MKKIIIFFVLIAFSICSNAQNFSALYTFDGVNTTSGLTDPSSVPTATGVTLGSFSAVGTSANSIGTARFSYSGWPLGALNGNDLYASLTGAINTAKYYEVTISPNTNYFLDLDSITFTIQKSSTGIRTYCVRSSADGYATNLAASIDPGNSNLSVQTNDIFFLNFDANTTAQNGSTITLGGVGFTGLSTPITFRFYGWNTESGTGTFSIDNVIFKGGITTLQVVGTNLTCYGSNNGSATATPLIGTQPFTYSWAPSGGNLATATGLAVGNYTVSATDFNSITTSATVIITQPATLSFTTSKTNVNPCNGGNSGSITVTPSGGTGIKQYSKDGGSTYQLSNIFNGLVAGTYQIVVKDANNCTTISQNIIITEPTLLSFTYSTVDAACYGDNTGSISVSANDGTPGYLYSKNGGSTYQSSYDFSGLVAGTYQVVVKDLNNCITPIQSVTIAQPPLLSFTYTQINVACNGANTGSVTVTESGGTGPYEYSKDGGSTYQASNVLNGLYGSTYNIKVKDASNCVTPNQSVTITQPASAITISISNTNVSCYGNNTGSANILATGGTGTLTYNWLPYGGTSSMADSLTAGTYAVTVTDSNSCVATDNAIITQPQGALNINTGIVQTDCGYTNGQITAYVSGGTLPYHYLWSNGGTTNIIENLPANSYTLTVTDTNGCIATTPILTVGTYLPDFGLAFTAISTTGVAPFFAGFTNSTPGLSSYNFTWFWGDGTSTSSNSTNATHTYQYSGFYDVSLVATNIADGCADTLKKIGYIFLTGPTSITQLEVADVISIFPNPATTKLNINGLTKNNRTITVTNVLGENVKTVEINGNTMLEINVEGLTTGVYFIKINNRSYKFIKS